MSKVLITTVPFGDIDRYPLDLLEKKNISYTINPLGKKLTENELFDMVGDSEVIIAGTEAITEKIMSVAPNLRMISRVGIGLDSVDLISAKKRNIAVSYTPDAPAPAVVDLTMGLMYSLSRNIHQSNIELHQGKWHRFFGKRLVDCTIGLIGVGRVGSQVLENLKVLGCKSILYYDKKVTLKTDSSGQVKPSSREEIFKNSDIISLHVPLDFETNNMITINEFKLMKKSAYIVNTARGGVINENDLYFALTNNLIAGAAIDTFETEPYNGKLIELNNCLITSHMGSMSYDCRTKMEIEATEEAVRFLTNNFQKCAVPQEEYDMRNLSF